MSDDTKRDKVIESLKSNTLNNYIIPGLKSSLIAQNKGLVRLFESTRTPRSSPAPHNHRFDFTCCVLEGSVLNVTYHEVTGRVKKTDEEFIVDHYCYDGAPGKYHRIHRSATPRPFRTIEKKYNRGDWYSMTAHEIHTIYFYKGAKVLFFEGPTKFFANKVLLPYEAGKIVETLNCEQDWQFIRE